MSGETVRALSDMAARFHATIRRADESRQQQSADVRDAIQTLMASHGHTLTVEQRAAVRAWLGRVA